MMKEINFQLTVDEINTILEALGQMPYVKVFPLINKIQGQAQQQLNDTVPSAEGGEPATLLGSE